MFIFQNIIQSLCLTLNRYESIKMCDLTSAPECHRLRRKRRNFTCAGRNARETFRFQDPATVLSLDSQISRRNNLKVRGKHISSESRSHTCSKSHGTFTLSDWLSWALNALHFNFLPPSMPRPKPPSLYLHVIFFHVYPGLFFCSQINSFARSTYLLFAQTCNMCLKTL